ncbi:hypothetical protein [Cetobacterium sp.]|uniref:hypothetical protein n=1 Tax=Cetobacterium sp. TaxID=2071632 RepID=UPI003EE4B51C
MSKNLDNLLSYEINESKFLKILTDGISFETQYQQVNYKQNGSKKMFEQTLQYNLYSDTFLEINKEKLLKLGVIKIKNK